MQCSLSGNTSVAAGLDGPVEGYGPCCTAASMHTRLASCFLEPPPRPPDPPLPPSRHPGLPTHRSRLQGLSQIRHGPPRHRQYASKA